MDPEIIEELKGRLGTVIGGRWKLVKILGLGASAGVYRGVDTQGWRVAVKVMHSKFLRSKMVRARFIREQSILDQIQHKHTLRVYETAETLDGLPYIVMELLEGQTLARIMTKRGEVPLEIERVVSYMLPVLDVLELCHGKQILHRDLKPANIFFTQEGVIKLLDFGVARYHQDGKNLTRDGATLGTPAFMAPEQASGRMDRLDGRSDIFSVGATMHYLLSGQYIHDEETAQMTYLKAATTPAPSLARHAPHLPLEVVQVVDKAVAWNPSDRWQSAQAMAAELRGLLEGARIKTTRERSQTVQGMGVGGTHTGMDASAQQLAKAAAVVKKPLRIKEFFGALERTMLALLRYGSKHTMSEGRLQELEATLRQLIPSPGDTFTLEVRPYGLESDVEGAPSFAPAEPLDEVCYALCASGVQRVRLLARITRGDLKELLGLLLRPIQEGLRQEDDLATAIWDRQLVGVELELSGALGQLSERHHRAMDQAFAVQLDAVGETVRSEIALEQERFQMMQALGERELAERERALAAPRLDVALPLSAGSAPVGADPALDEQELVSLRAQHRKQRQSWALRLGTVMGDVIDKAWKEGEEGVWLEPLGGMATQLAEAGRVHEFLSFLAVMMRQMPLPELRGALVSQAIPPEVLRALFGSLGIMEASAEQPSRTLEPEEQYALTLLIDHLDDRHIALVIDALSSRTPAAERLHAPLLEMLRSELAGHEALLGERLLKTPAHQARELIPLLLAQGAPGRQALFPALAHPEGEVALAALKALLPEAPRARHGELIEAIERLAWHHHAALRRQALEVVVGAQFAPYLTSFQKRFFTKDFHLFSIEEQRASFEQLRALSSPGAEEVSVALLTPNEAARDQTRLTTQLLAVEDLARNGFTREAFTALEQARRHHPWMSRDVQEAAARAYGRFCERLGLVEGG